MGYDWLTLRVINTHMLQTSSPSSKQVRHIRDSVASEYNGQV